MRFVIITGMSGAGKSSALKMLEDNNFFCVDNLPIELIIKFAELTFNNSSDKNRDVALGLDIRSGQALQELEEVLDQMTALKYSYEILFLDANDESHSDPPKFHKTLLRSCLPGNSSGMPFPSAVPKPPAMHTHTCHDKEWFRSCHETRTPPMRENRR